MYSPVAICIHHGYDVAMSDTEATIGDVLQRARFRKGWTLREAAEKCGLAVGTIQRLEAGIGTPLGRTVVLYADALGVDPDPLLDQLQVAS